MSLTQPCSKSWSQYEQDVYWMDYALELAKKAEQQGEVPVGAVLVSGTNLISEGWNQTIQSHDPTAHAEVVALRSAGKKLQNYRLVDLTLYVTLEPCPMCAGGLVHARIKRLVYATQDLKTGAAGSVMNLISHEGLNHSIESEAGIRQNEASNLLSQFFQHRRKQRKNLKPKP